MMYNFIYTPTEIPKWLDVYYKASSEHDHKLKWELFRLPELDAFQAMLTRLYKEDLRSVVMDYEAYRQALLREIERRHRQAQLHIQVILVSCMAIKWKKLYYRAKLFNMFSSCDDINRTPRYQVKIHHFVQLFYFSGLYLGLKSAKYLCRMNNKMSKSSYSV